MLEKNPNKIDLYKLSTNPLAIPLMKTNVYKTNLLCNPSIFRCDYVFHKERMDVLREEKVFHPKRLQYYLDLDYDNFMDYDA